MCGTETICDTPPAATEPLNSRKAPKPGAASYLAAAMRAAAHKGQSMVGGPLVGQLLRVGRLGLQDREGRRGYGRPELGQ